MTRRQGSAPPLVALLIAALSLSACAHAGDARPSPLPIERAANERARLYAACAADGGASGDVTRVGRYVRLTCKGTPARALFDAAETFSRSRGRETVEGAVTVRRIGAEPWFDACRRDGEAYSCFVHLLAPLDFLNPENDVAPPKAK